ncbi:MAG: NAD-dependent epimerase/dehydratase family protein [Sulfuricurvum sp.]
MKIVICGMSGFVGSALFDFLSLQHHEVVALSIRSSTALEAIVKILDGSDVIINLAGANILGRWSAEYKKVLRSSRLDTTASLTHALTHCVHPPHTLINASAVGVYDSYHQHDEHSRHLGDDFLASLVQDWEEAALGAKTLGTRVCIMRFGVVYGKEGGCDGKNASALCARFGWKNGRWIPNDLMDSCARLGAWMFVFN